MKLRVLTVSDLHQSRRLYQQLAGAVELHKPDIVALVGDFLGADLISQSNLLSVVQAAEALSSLSSPHLVFVRGNHEQEEWRQFVHAWPFEKRPLTALYGSALQIGPLVVVGFPCHIGWDGPWCETLSKAGNELTPDQSRSGREALPIQQKRWLPQLMRQLGPSGRTLWLSHEPPVAMPIASPHTFNSQWTDAVERFCPLVVVSGHDHDTPRWFNTWHCRLNDTVCLNLGQSATDLHYCVLDFEFTGAEPALPRKVTIEAFPRNAKIVLPSA